MRLRLGVALSSALAVSVGLITLVGLLVGDDLGLVSSLVANTPIRLMALVFLRLAIITIALTVLVGIANLLFVHITRITRGRGGRISSIMIIASFVAAIMASVANRSASLLLLEVQIAIESALAGLLFFALVWGAARILRDVTMGRLLFVITMLIVLAGAVPLAGLEPLATLRDWVVRIPVNAGARGILLGIALATVVAGLRVLFGQDRSYSE